MDYLKDFIRYITDKAQLLVEFGAKSRYICLKTPL